eukprot:11831082-Prorocentrum_lima.AAC.1
MVETPTQHGPEGPACMSRRTRRPRPVPLPQSGFLQRSSQWQLQHRHSGWSCSSSRSRLLHH